MTNIVSLVHIFGSGPLLLYLGLRQQKPLYLYYILLVVGIILGIFFIIDFLSNKKRLWLLIHLLVFVPLLIYCGIMKDKTPPIVLSIFIALGCAAIGYHIIRLVKFF